MRRKLLVSALLVIALAFMGVTTAYPAAATVLCPSCYGFDRVSANLYVERGAGLAVRTSIEGTVMEARKRVRGFYGELLSEPKILICVTEACYRGVGGGGSRGMAILDRALFLSPHGTTSVIASHELAHIELHHRIGLLATLRRDIPQWFDEGLAVTISNDPRYLASPTQADRCLISSDEPLPNDRKSWIETAAAHDLYAKAACRVTRWLSAHGNAHGVERLVDDLAEGRPFEDASRR